MREQVKWFADQMEQTLQRNDHKGGWDSCSFDYLLDRLEQETQELFLASEAPTNNFRENIIREATDVANFAMMIADLARKG